ncbi:reverse transcriptase family protein [Roseateles depolymerans]|uniref:RNA-directed DNA polymerase n=1 Tax=Roseateles depolymerans TaxID=76731 RepID=A0A0U3N921_9BURK|nr:reverse transcriptase family protein [Roseateles depolymerans]ALV08651.1 RNA-directed DNA polymerase [Roseateles depolymerans]REG21125.1 RNA-directed DNA polymerase [Roseateles depolymerans]
MTSSASLTYPRWIALALARAFQTDDDAPGGRSPQALLGRGMACVGEEHRRWLLPLCQHLASLSAPVWLGMTPRTLAEHLDQRPEFFDAWDPAGPRLQVRRLLLRPARMTPPPFALEDLPLPAWHTVADLAAGLGIDLSMLDVLAGPAQRYREAEARPHRPHVQAIRHYRAVLVPKRRGGLRLIEAPMPALKAVQRRLLRSLLDLVPVHEAAHGFVAGRNVASHAGLHAGQDWVFRFDLQDFFPGIGAARIRALFRTLGMEEAVAEYLTTLCTVRTPRAVRERLQDDGGLTWIDTRRLAAPHLPQGAPTSPQLANLCAFRLDLRLDGLAARFGAQYSRYADDLVFSGAGTPALDAVTLHAWVKAIVEEEGFRLRPDKTRLMRAGGRQTVTGLVVNETPHIARADYDRLRAEMHRLGREPAVDLSLRAPLLGRLAWARQFVAPTRAAKLQRLFDAISFVQ